MEHLGLLLNENFEVLHVTQQLHHLSCFHTQTTWTIDPLPASTFSNCTTMLCCVFIVINVNKTKRSILMCSYMTFSNVYISHTLISLNLNLTLKQYYRLNCCLHHLSAIMSQCWFIIFYYAAFKGGRCKNSDLFQSKIFHFCSSVHFSNLIVSFSVFFQNLLLDCVQWSSSSLTIFVV